MDSFNTKTTLDIAGKPTTVYSFRKLRDQGHNVDRLPFSIKVLLENLLRHEDGERVSKEDVQAVLDWDPAAKPSTEIAYSPARVLLQDFTGVPCVVDLAVMRDAMKDLGHDAKKVNPLQPVELVIDHSVQVDAFAKSDAMLINMQKDFERNRERYSFLKWGQQAFQNFAAVPPNMGICHQVNLEYLGRVVFEKDGEAYYDTLVGTDSHTPMINGLGVLGWGVGGIEAEAAMLGQPVSMLLPQVIGVKVSGKLKEGTTATDLVLTITEMLRKEGVVGKFVEFFGPGIQNMPLADRATISNMSPEFGCTATLFPVDEETLRYMRFSGRQEDHVQRVRDYMEAQGTFHSAEAPEAEYTKLLELDLGSVVPSVAGPKRPQDRWNLERVRDAFFEFFPDSKPGSENEGEGGGTVVATEKKTNELTHASVVIAAITSCTNTSNPTLMLASGLVAKKCHELGINPKPWVKTSFAPGSRVVTRYMEQSGLMDELESVGFHLVGYGCTTCIGNSGPLPEEVAKEVTDKDLTVASVLSGNRNFEGRVNPLTKANFLMSPPLVVAYAMAGTVDIDLVNDPIAKDKDGNDVYLKDIWPSQKEVAEVLENNVTEDMYAKTYDEVFEGDDEWNEIEVSQSDLYPWNDDSTYIKKAPYFEGMPPEVPETVPDLQDLSVLALLGDSVTTDHISPAGAIKPDSPAGRYLIEQGVRPHEFNSFGARRGNHEVMIRGTFGNIRLRNLLAPGTEGGFTKYLPTGEVMDLYDAAMKYKAEGKGLIVLAGKEYGTGSSRDWAAKGTLLLGVKAVLAQSFERIHRSNLIGMGVLPLQFEEGEGVEELNLDAESPFTVEGIQEAYDRNKVIAQKFTVKAKNRSGEDVSFQVLCRIDTPMEANYYRHGGILQYVLRNLAQA